MVIIRAQPPGGEVTYGIHLSVQALNEGEAVSAFISPLEDSTFECLLFSEDEVLWKQHVGWACMTGMSAYQRKRGVHLQRIYVIMDFEEIRKHPARFIKSITEMYKISLAPDNTYEQGSRDILVMRDVPLLDVLLHIDSWPDDLPYGEWRPRRFARR